MSERHHKGGIASTHSIEQITQAYEHGDYDSSSAPVIASLLKLIEVYETALAYRKRQINILIDSWEHLFGAKNTPDRDLFNEEMWSE